MMKHKFKLISTHKNKLYGFKVKLLQAYIDNTYY